MKTRITPLTFLVLIVFVLGAGVPAQANAGRAEPFPLGPTPPLRIDEPLDQVIADLEAFIPAYLAEQGVPGASIALVRDGQVVWTAGFGVANRFTRRPVNPETTFKVASNSKVITAYIALRLVDQGVLDLDTPLDNYPPEPLLPQPEYRDQIYLRRTLSHNAGMGHGTPSRELILPPGEGYYYSAVGFLYTQDVIEAVTGEPLEALADELVFHPLGMEHSSYTNSPAVMEDPADGHIPALLFLILFVVGFLPVFTIFLIIALIWNRLRNGAWRLSRRTMMGLYLVACLGGCLVGVFLGAALGMWDYAIGISIYGLLLAAAFLAALFVGQALRQRALSNHPTLGGVFLLIWGALVFAGLGVLLYAAGQAPFPARAPLDPSAAGTVRASAGDMARFLIEIGDPRYLSPALAQELRTPQVSLSREMSWGLGPGIQHSSDGDALWQWGQAPDFQSVMIIYPDLGYGVVVMTNSDLFNPDVAIDIAARALGGQTDPIRRGIHLGFNHPGPYLR